MLAGCAGFRGVALRTRATADGGEYTVYAHRPQDAARSVRDALAAIAQECNGTYEVRGIELLPISPRTMNYYVDLDGSIAWGSFETGIAYECRAPDSEVLNERLADLAATVPPDPPPETPKPPKPPEPCIVTYDCPVGSVCAPTAAACEGR